MEPARPLDPAAKLARTRASRVHISRRERVLSLSIVIAGDEPPNEFCIFTAGTVTTTKGDFIFDEAASAAVMAEYQAHGIDLMIDYDHAAVRGLSLDPALSGKAAGWFNLEVRDGALWAVNVRWTPPAAEALRRKEWRFMSPAFHTDEEGRVTGLMNVAITNLPATRQLDPLMAASTREVFMLDSKLVGEALDALIAGDEAKCAEILKGMVAAAAGADPDASTEDAPPPAGDGGADEGVEAAADPAVAPPEEKKAEVVAATSRLMRLTGATTSADAFSQIEAWRASHLRLEAETTKIAKERQAIELHKRKENAISLTKLGAETPHTTGLAKGKLCKRLLEEPLDEQSDRVAALLAARGGKMPAEPKAPVTGSETGLSSRELQMCAEKNIDPAKYAKTRAGIRARNANGVDT